MIINKVDKRQTDPLATSQTPLASSQTLLAVAIKIDPVSLLNAGDC